MKGFASTLLSSLLLFILSSVFPSGCDGVVLCKGREREALLQFKNGFTRDELNLLSTWDAQKEEDCCRWRGITCNNLTGHVIQLILRADYEIMRKTTGKISPSLVELEYLEKLELYWFDFGRNPIPSFLGSFKKLRYLKLINANFFGTIPFQLGNLSALETLALSLNVGLASDGAWLFNLSSLRYLNLALVNLSTATHLFEALSMSSFITTIDFTTCSLDLRSLSLQHANFTRLSTLILSNNYMEFKVPQWLSNMTSLENLEIQYCNVMHIDRHVNWRLCNLRKLNLLGSRIEDGGLDNIFMGCHGLPKLVYLNLCATYITGHLPASLGDSKSLVYLNAKNNNLSGSFPEFISGIQSLRHVDLSGNNFSGNIPASLWSLPSCEYIDLSYNNFSGSIAESIFARQSLRYLDLSHNHLSGSLTEAHLNNLTRLTELYLASTGLHFMVSPGWVPTFQLEYLDMSFCRAGPRFPSWLQNQSGLINLNMANAGISGTIPQWIWSFSSQMNNMDFSMNMIKGIVPAAVNVTKTYKSIILDSNKL